MFFSIAFSVATFLTFTLNPTQPEKYAWKDRKVFPNSTDCGTQTSLGIVCVSTFEFQSGSSFAAVAPDYVFISSVVISPGNSVFLSYNYTGPDWILKIGVQ